MILLHHSDLLGGGGGGGGQVVDHMTHIRPPKPLSQDDTRIPPMARAERPGGRSKTTADLDSEEEWKAPGRLHLRAEGARKGPPV